ncbi:hypothetical protein EVD33_13730 [Bacteroidales bacterium SW292]|nr:hypothetical protein [Bacteroidales bacterium SW292]
MIRIFLLGIVFIFTSCAGKTYLSDLKYVQDKETNSLFAYDKDGSPFNGIAWSKDGKTLSIEVDNGLVISEKAFHKNGEIAVFVSFTSKKLIYYDETGKEITENEAKEQINPETIARIRAAGYEMGLADD